MQINARKYSSCTERKVKAKELEKQEKKEEPKEREEQEGTTKLNATPSVEELGRRGLTGNHGWSNT